MEILIPKSINDSTKIIDSIAWQIGKLRNGEKVILNLSEVTFIEPSGSIFLVILCRQIYNLTNERVELKNINYDLNNYLKRIEFPRIVENWAFIKTNSWLYNINISTRSKTTVIELTQLKKGDKRDLYTFNKMCREIIEKWFGYEQYEEYRERSLTVIREACSNAIEHSESDAYVTLQKYSYPKTKIMISVGDLGIGIKEHLKRVHGWVGKNDVDFIKQALSGKSGRTDKEGGFGLKTIQGITSKQNGEIRIRSGKGLIIINEGVKEYIFNHNFPGTQYTIILK